MRHTLFCALILGMSTLLSGELSHQCLDKIPDTWRLRIHRPKMRVEKCDPSVIAEVPVTRPGFSSELHKGQLLGPVKYPARYRTRRGEVLAELVSLRGRRGHAPSH